MCHSSQALDCDNLNIFNALNSSTIMTEGAECTCTLYEYVDSLSSRENIYKICSPLMVLLCGNCTLKRYNR